MFLCLHLPHYFPGMERGVYYLFLIRNGLRISILFSAIYPDQYCKDASPMFLVLSLRNQSGLVGGINEPLSCTH